MIGKIPRPGNGFRGAFNYLMYGKKNEEREDRAAWFSTRNMFVADIDKVPSMMRATAQQSTRCKKPAYHMLISWRHDENPSEEVMRMAAERTLADLGLSEHQAMLAAHYDTGHKHLHILVNRVHPVTGKAWHTSKDWERMERSIGRQAKELGLLFVPGRHNQPDMKKARPQRARDGEYQQAKREGAELPQARFSKDEILSRRKQLAPVFDQARSWDQLSRLLAAEGLSVHAKGQGLVISDGMGFMKLSDLGKEIRIKGLEQLYGESFSAFEQRRSKELSTKAPELSPTAVQPSPAAPPRSPRQVKPPFAGDHAPSRRDGGKPHDTPTPKDDNYAKQLEEHNRRDELREQWLAARRAATPQPPPVTTSGDDEGSQADTASGRELPRQAPPADPAQEARSDAFKRLGAASDSLDMARRMYAAGLITEADLIRARNEMTAARDNLAQHQTFDEFVQEGVRKAFSEEPGARKPKPRPRKKPTRENDRDDDLDR